MITISSSSKKTHTPLKNVMPKLLLFSTALLRLKIANANKRFRSKNINIRHISHIDGMEEKCNGIHKVYYFRHYLIIVHVNLFFLFLV